MFSDNKEPRKANFDYQIDLRDFKELSNNDLKYYLGRLKKTDLLDEWYKKYDVTRVPKMFN